MPEQTNEEPRSHSRRFKAYARDNSPRGRSLALAYQLTELKKSYPDFEEILRATIFHIREQGSPRTRKTERIIEELKTGAAEVSEISEALRIKPAEVREICLELVKKNLVRLDHRKISTTYANNQNATGRRENIREWKGNQHTNGLIELFLWRETEFKLK